MNSSQPSNSGIPAVITVVQITDASSELERFAVAYARFDALMTAQLQELEHKFRDYWTPRAKLASGRRS